MNGVNWRGTGENQTNCTPTTVQRQMQTSQVFDYIGEDGVLL